MLFYQLPRVLLGRYAFFFMVSSVGRLFGLLAIALALRVITRDRLSPKKERIPI